MRTLLAMATVVSLLGVMPAMAQSGLDREQRETVRAIRIVFGPSARDALRVAWCESRFRPWARNGQYQGVFQMGSSERARFGHGRSALQQARAAHRYFRLAGWRPWQCMPNGGLRW